MRRFLARAIAPSLITLVALTSASPARAQATPQAPGTEPPGATEQPAKPDSDASLSKKLDKNEGVLTPPHDVDPEMHKEPGATGDKMPVIVPPGEPGGDQSVQPK